MLGNAPGAVRFQRIYDHLERDRRAGRQQGAARNKGKRHQQSSLRKAIGDLPEELQSLAQGLTNCTCNWNVCASPGNCCCCSSSTSASPLACETARRPFDMVMASLPLGRPCHSARATMHVATRKLGRASFTAVVSRFFPNVFRALALGAGVAREYVECNATVTDVVLFASRAIPPCSTEGCYLLRNGRK